jgi:hypothetical protein
MNRAQRWIVSATVTCGLLVLLEEKVTEALRGAPFLTDLVQNWMSPSKYSKEVDDARQKARTAAAAARAVAETYPKEQVERALQKVASMKLVGHDGPPSQVRPSANYWGPLRNNAATGIGHLEWNDGSIFDGEFKNDRIDGVGRLVFTDGNRTEGEFKGGSLNGFGCYSHNDRRDCGWYQDNAPFGPTKSEIGLDKPLETLISTEKFTVATFLADVENGSPGMRYEGEMSNNARNGFGIAYYPNGSRYEGRWEQRWQQGFGAKINAQDKVENAGLWEHGLFKQ